MNIVEELESRTGEKISDNEIWFKHIEKLDFAFQPIVNINTGVCLGFEVLLRNFQSCGFSSINDFFDKAFKCKVLYSIDLLLREKAVKKFKEILFNEKVKLFYNLDNRLLLMPNYSTGNTSKILSENKLSFNSIAFEISERHEINHTIEAQKVLEAYKSQDYKIAIDDFGTGFSGLKMLYHCEPDFIKIDRFFIEGISNDHKKKIFVTKVINLSHILGMLVIAEGVETEKEFLVCKEIGCDFVQGYLIQKPVRSISKLHYKYEKIVELNKKDRRKNNSDDILVREQLSYLKPIIVFNTSMSEVFDMFKENNSITFFPVINDKGEPLGLIREKDLKRFVYSKYGKDILLNKGTGMTIQDFISECPVSEVFKSIERILDIFSIDENSEGIIITENNKYIGFLSAKSILRVLHEKNIAIARDQNPLTKLPGNNLINKYISETYYDYDKEYIYIYFDFDDFKPFNDRFGFRIGDRAILLFSEILKKEFDGEKYFKGHIGGDDFFCGVRLTVKKNTLINKIKEILKQFKNGILSFYNDDEKMQGFYISKSRYGRKKKFSLLSVSASILYLTNERKNTSVEELSQVIADIKKASKKSKNKIQIKEI